MRTTRASHKGHEKTPVTERRELVRDRGIRWIVSAEERRMAWISDVKEENLMLPPHQAAQATEGQRAPIVGEADMVRLVAYGPVGKRGRERDGTEDVAIVWRAGIEVDNGDEV